MVLADAAAEIMLSKLFSIAVGAGLGAVNPQTSTSGGRLARTISRRCSVIHVGSIRVTDKLPVALAVSCARDVATRCRPRILLVRQRSITNCSKSCSLVLL